MSKTSPEVTPDTHLQEPAAPIVEGNHLMLIIQIQAEMIYNYLFLIYGYLLSQVHPYFSKSIATVGYS